MSSDEFVFEKKINPNAAKIVGIVCGILSLVLSVFLVLNPMDSESIRVYGYFGVFFSNMLSTATMFFSGAHFIVPIVAATKLNPFLVIVFSALGMTAGEVTGYLIGNAAPEKFKRNKLFKKVDKWMGINGPRTIFWLAFLPSGGIFDFAGLIAGGLKYPLWEFLRYSFYGRLARSVILVFIGCKFF